MKRKLLGHVGVDSGQLIITDPCYIDSEWKKEEFKDIRIYKHKKTGVIYMYAGGSKKLKGYPQAQTFKHYDDLTKNGMTMNEMIQKKQVKELDVKEKTDMIGSYSYAGVCETTLSDNHQLNYELGHNGVGVAFRSGYGDGYYPVYGWFHDGRCIKVEIDCGMTKTQKALFKTLK